MEKPLGGHWDWVSLSLVERKALNAWMSKVLFSLHSSLCPTHLGRCRDASEDGWLGSSWGRWGGKWQYGKSLGRHLWGRQVSGEAFDLWARQRGSPSGLWPFFCIYMPACPLFLLRRGTREQGQPTRIAARIKYNLQNTGPNTELVPGNYCPHVILKGARWVEGEDDLSVYRWGATGPVRASMHPGSNRTSCKGPGTQRTHVSTALWGFWQSSHRRQWLSPLMARSCLSGCCENLQEGPELWHLPRKNKTVCSRDI